METKLEMNITNFCSSIWTKLLGTIVTTLFLLYIDVASNLWQKYLIEFVFVHILCLVLVWIWPISHFINYYLNDKNIQIEIDYKSNKIKIKNAVTIRELLSNEILLIQRIEDSRSIFHFMGYFYYKIESTKGTYYVSMFTTSKLDFYFPDVKFEKIVDFLVYIPQKYLVITNCDNQIQNHG